MENLTINDVKEIKVAYTHGGVFHADDIFSTALLKLINQDIKIERVFKVPEDAELAFDIGFGKYDHHQSDAEVRENGIPYAAFGLLWRDLGKEIVGEEQAKKMDEHFVQEIDWTDNVGPQVHPNMLSSAISVFNPNWDDDRNDPKHFEKAVFIATEVLLAKINTALAAENAIKILDYSIVRDGVLELDRFVPWTDYILSGDHDDVKLCMFPSPRGEFNVQAIPVSKENPEYRVSFPQEWYGAPENELPDGVSFCHKSGFMIACNTQEDARRIAKEVIK